MNKPAILEKLPTGEYLCVLCGNRYGSELSGKKHQWRVHRIQPTRQGGKP